MGRHSFFRFLTHLSAADALRCSWVSLSCLLLSDFGRILKDPYGGLAQPSSKPLPRGISMAVASSVWGLKCLEMSPRAAPPSHISNLSSEEPLAVSRYAANHPRDCTEIPIVCGPPGDSRPSCQTTTIVYKCDPFHQCFYLPLWQSFYFLLLSQGGKLSWAPPSATQTCPWVGFSYLESFPRKLSDVSFMWRGCKWVLLRLDPKQKRKLCFKVNNDSSWETILWNLFNDEKLQMSNFKWHTFDFTFLKCLLFQVSSAVYLDNRSVTIPLSYCPKLLCPVVKWLMTEP